MPVHFWSSGMTREAAQSYLADLCGVDHEDYTEFEHEVTCERCLAILRRDQVTAPTAAPNLEAAMVAEAERAQPVAGGKTIADTMALLRKRKEFETELAKLINRLSLEQQFGNRPDYDLARIAWELLSK